MSDLAAPARAAAVPDAPRRAPTWNGGTDVGLLLMRLAVGGPFVAHGLQKVFGLLGGSGPAGFARALEAYGFTSPVLLSWVTGLTELVGGALVVFGLLTPLAATGLLAVMLNTLLLKAGTPFFPGTAGPGWELNAVLALAAAAVVLTGPGRIALDNGRPWHRRPGLAGLACLLVGVAAGLAVFVLLRR
ncbi:MAG: DoxX family protein [Pseudonocardia sp.]